ncbi:hypothetical protein EV356DRAFT_521021 [Viridothelium virens]|uniref:Uncharacterized protein n=1 Tax=Viridothelium virens TaxID=1048519 RepID=A0A6A6GUQ7_VIRVR|nr:hypothetical protein EV356DRAFT_521021 [Viridothelium virens]
MFSGNSQPWTEFDQNSIPVMELLVRNGAVVIAKDEQCANTTSGRLPFGHLIPELPIVCTLMARRRSESGGCESVRQIQRGLWASMDSVEMGPELPRAWDS